MPTSLTLISNIPEENCGLHGAIVSTYQWYYIYIYTFISQKYKYINFFVTSFIYFYVQVCTAVCYDRQVYTCIIKHICDNYNINCTFGVIERQLCDWFWFIQHHLWSTLYIHYLHFKMIFVGGGEFCWGRGICVIGRGMGQFSVFVPFTSVHVLPIHDVHMFTYMYISLVSISFYQPSFTKYIFCIISAINFDYFVLF